jgi:hypothetical protein
MALPLGVHFLCLPKENEPKEKAPDIALIPIILHFYGEVDNSLTLRHSTSSSIKVSSSLVTMDGVNLLIARIQ